MPSKRPNIVCFITDDTGENMLGYAGGPVLTPNIDRIANGGVVCTQFHTAAPACCPSRFSYLTGRYPGHCRAPRFAEELTGDRPYNLGFNVDVLPGTPTVGSALQQAGYRTGYVGKWHTGIPRGQLNGHRYQPDDDPTDPDVARRLREDYQAMQEQVRGTGFDFADGVCWGNTDGRPIRALQYHNLEWFTQAAMDFLDGSEGGDPPFFLYYATTTMHGPHHTRSIETDGRATEWGLLDEMPRVQAPRETIEPRLGEAGLEITHRTTGALWMDDAFGAIMERVERMGEADNTIFLFSTDHGIGTAGSKFTCYQAGVRIPFCMSWQGHISAGSECDALLENVDFLPTLCAAVGADVPSDPPVDGLDRWAQLTGEAPDDREDLYFEWGFTRAVRTRRFKYIAWRHPSDQLEAMKGGAVDRAYNMAGKAGPDFPMRMHPHYFDADQLYDLQSDPGELVNLAAYPEYADVLADMQARLQRYLNRFDAPFDLDGVDPFLATEAYRDLVTASLNDRKLREMYFYRELAY